MSDNNEALAEQLAAKHYKAMCAKGLGHLSTIDTIASAVREALNSRPAEPSGEAVKPRFPTMLRKMWSGGEVQDWIDKNWPDAADTVPRSELEAALTLAKCRHSDSVEAVRQHYERRIAELQAKAVPDKVLLEALHDELQTGYDTDGHEGPEGDAAIRLCDAMGAVESVLTRLRSQFSEPGEWQCAHAHDGAYGWEIFKAGTHERLCGDMTESGAMAITAALNSAPAPAASPVVPEWPVHWVDQHVYPKDRLHKAVAVPFEVLIRAEFELTHSPGPEASRPIILILRDIIKSAESDSDLSGSECGNCFEGKSDLDHECQKCGGTGAIEK